MGIQGSMWTEFCNKPEEVEYLIFPRLAAVAEVAWTFPVYKDWDRFLAALDNFTGHLDVKGITYARSMYNIQHKVISDGRQSASRSGMYPPRCGDTLHHKRKSAHCQVFSL